MQEFSRHQNQFSPGQLRNCKLLLVSDITEISKIQKDVLRRILGRDTQTDEQKYSREFGVISPDCAVMFMSNVPPTKLEFDRDPAIADKLFTVHLPDNLTIPPQYRIANVAQFLDPIVPDIYNWATHCTTNS